MSRKQINERQKRAIERAAPQKGKGREVRVPDTKIRGTRPKAKPNREVIKGRGRPGAEQQKKVKREKRQQYNKMPRNPVTRETQRGGNQTQGRGEIRKQWEKTNPGPQKEYSPRGGNPGLSGKFINKRWK